MPKVSNSTSQISNTDHVKLTSCNITRFKREMNDLCEQLHNRRQSLRTQVHIRDTFVLNVCDSFNSKIRYEIPVRISHGRNENFLMKHSLRT